MRPLHIAYIPWVILGRSVNQPSSPHIKLQHIGSSSSSHLVLKIFLSRKGPRERGSILYRRMCNTTKGVRGGYQ